MIIEDDELRALFQAESQEHLQCLEHGLLRLETNPNDNATLEELFREAHSLKGSARMLGVVDVETIAHRFEDVLGASKRGQLTLTADLVDRLCRALDCIRQLVEEAVTGKQAGVDVLRVLAELRDAPSAGASETAPHEMNASPGAVGITSSLPKTFPHNTSPETTEALPASDGDMPGSASDSPVAGVVGLPASSEAATPLTGERAEELAARYRIETIRVDPRKLDLLMTQAGELVVTKIRSGRRLTEIGELVSLWEEWGRESSMRRSMRDSRTSGTKPETELELETFQQRVRSRVERLGSLLGRLASGVQEDYQRLDFIAKELEEGIRTVRLLPLSTIFQLYVRTVRDLSRELGKDVQLVVEGGDTTADKQILEEMKGPLMHMIRNAIDHGIETPEERIRSGKSQTGSIRLLAYQTATNVVIEVGDDGRGLDLEVIRKMALKRGLGREEDLDKMSPPEVQALIFAPGFSVRSAVSDISGRGVGMDVARANVERLKGTIRVESITGRGCRFRIELPLNIATTRVLIVSEGQRAYAVPIDSVQSMCSVSFGDIHSVGGRTVIMHGGRPISVVRLADLLELPGAGSADAGRPALPSGDSAGDVPCMVLAAGEERVGCLVDALLDEQEVVLKRHSPILKRVRNVSGATILGTGEVCIVLNPNDLIRSAQERAKSTRLQPGPVEQDKPVILLVEDSITTRTLEKRILETAGYEVVTAVDGVDGLAKLHAQEFDAVVSDIQMPNMDGLVFTEAVRRNKRYADLPIILVTSLEREEDQRRGLDAGANAYITKPAFDQKLLLDALRRLV